MSKLDETIGETLNGPKRKYTIRAVNKYDRFDLDFLKRENGRVYNDTFDVTNSSERLTGVWTGEEEVRLADYLVFRKLPKKLRAWADRPNVDEHSEEMLDFYKEILKYCKHGVWIDDEYYNPLYMYWLNLFVFPVIKSDKNGKPLGEIMGSPTYCTIDRYIFDLIYKAILTGKDFALMGSRGIGKSYAIISIIDQYYRIFKKTHTLVTSTDSHMTNEAWRKVVDCLDLVEEKHPPLKHKRISDTGDKKLSGETFIDSSGDEKKRGYKSLIEKIIYDKSTDKTRGSRPNIQHIEEFAAFPPKTHKGNLKGVIAGSKGSWFIGGTYKKCTVLYTGTGGSVNNDEARDVFTNPDAYNILKVNDWPEMGDRGCGAFIPVQLKMAGHWERTGTPDITKSLLTSAAKRKAVKSDAVAYMGEVQEYPTNPTEMFMQNGSNIFDQDKIATQQSKIQFGTEDEVSKPIRGFLTWVKGPNGERLGVKWEDSNVGDMKIMEHPVWLTNPDKYPNPIENLYIIGCDSIDQGNSDSSAATNSTTGSELCAMVKKRFLEGSYFSTTSNIYVGLYNKRSNNVRDDWENTLKLSMYFNAQINLEFTKVGIKIYFESEGFLHKFARRTAINLPKTDKKKASTLIGTTTGSGIIDYQDQKVADYINDNCSDIWFPEALTQLQAYNRENRTPSDLVIAMGLCELLDEDLVVVAKPPVETSASGFKLFGIYKDENGIKRRGEIPNNIKRVQDAKANMVSDMAKRFNEHGGVTWENV